MIVSQERFAALLKNLKDRIEKLFPITGERNSISVSNLRWVNTGLDVYGDPEIHKKYKTTGRTLAARLLGDVSVVDTTTNKILDRQNGHPILAVPHLTSKQSFIVGGKEVQIVNQIRLKSGTYTRYTADNNVETFINTAGGGYRIQFDRVRQIFRIRVGQSTYVYLYPILKALAVNDVDLRRIWGDEILQENRKYDRPAELGKLYKKMRPYAEEIKTQEDLAEAVKSFFASKPLDPNITNLTLGAKYSHIEPKVLVASSEKALKLARGEVKADDTENLAYKSLHSVDDFVIEKLEQNIPAVERAIKYQIDRRPSVVDVMPPSLFTKPVQRFFTTSEFSRYSDQNNPIDMVGVQSLVTSMGEGGISSVYAVSDRLRALHPSHLGILDPVQTPESSKIGINAHLALGAKKIGNEIGLTVINAKTGLREPKKAFDLEDKVLAFYDEFDHTRTPPKAKSPQVKARFKGEFRLMPANKVDYILDSPAKIFSFASNAVPFIHTNSPNRVLMASHHISQAVPLSDPDVPLVQSKFGARGYETAVGERIAPQASVNGVVKRISAKKITIQGDDGKTYIIPLHDHYPLNSNAFLTEKAIVAPGQRVHKGQPIADSDFTRGGALAIGKSLRVGFMPYKGYNFEDGIVVSETAAKKLTSAHKHELSLNLDSTINVGLPVFLAHFPAEAEGVDRSKYDANGVVKAGAILSAGDVAIPAVRKIKVHEEFSYASLHRSLSHQWQDVSVRWDSDYPAEVMNVVKTRKFITVYVKTSETLEIGDKLSNRHGGKGIVTMILPDKEMYSGEDKKPLDVLFNPSGVLGRANPGVYLEAAAGKIATKTGKTYLVNNFVGKDARRDIQNELASHGLNRNSAERLYDSTTNKYHDNVMTGTLHFVKLRHQVSKKLSARGHTTYTHDESPARGTGSSPMAIGMMEMYSLLSSGGTAFLRDVTTIKCLPWNAQVETEFGPMNISSIVNNKMSLRVQSRDEAGNLVWKRVTGYFKYQHGKPSRRVPGCDRPLVDVEIPKIRPGKGRRTSLRATDNHEVMTARGKVQIRDLSDDDAVIVTGSALSGAQKAVLTGTLCGDACIADHDKMQLPRLSLCHCLAQQEYLLWKMRLLSDLTWGTPYPTKSISPDTGRECPQFAANSSCSLALVEFEERFYEDSHKGVRRKKHRRKKIDEQSLEFFDVRSAAFMFMDDGTVSCKPTKKDHRGALTVRFCIGDVTCREAEILAKRFRNLFGIDASWTKKAGGNQRILYVTGFDAQELLFQMAPFVHPVFDYKMIAPRRGVESALKALVGMRLADLEAECRADRSETTYPVPFKVRLAPKTARYTSFVYDIEVEDTHNYVVSGVVVGNSQKNDEFWRAIQLGLPTPQPKSPFVVDKFMAYMKGAGINVRQDGKTLKALPLTDADILGQSNGAITSPGVVRANDLSPEPKGLFDRGLTGGFDGVYWNHITLEGPIANPLMDQAIIGVLSKPSRPFKRSEFSALINGTLLVTPEGDLTKEHTKGTVSGGEGLRRLLAKIDVNADLQDLRRQVTLLKGDKRDIAVKKMRYLRALKDVKLTPVEAYTNSLVPVVPAKMRPIYPNPDGTLNVADPVHGYREVLLINNQINGLKTLGVDNQNLAPLRAQLYGAVRGLVGLQEPLTRSQNFKGFLAIIKGQQNKYGLFQGHVMKRRQDLSGRSTIIPDPNLGIDEAKIPEEMAFTIYKPFIVQRMGMLGYPPLKARDLIEKRDPVARAALEAVIKNRPVILNRAPSLHKFSLLSFKPMLAKGKAIEINPLVVKGFNADFDGDAMQVHVPVSEAARREASTTLLPSNNLFSPRDDSLIHSPSMEMVLGIYLMTTPKGAAVIKVSSEDEVIQMHKAGRIKVDQAVMVGGHRVCAGQIILNQAFPVGFKPGNISVDKSTLMNLLHGLARKKPAIAGQVISKMKDFGNKYVTEIGWSFDLGDLDFPAKERDAILAKAKKSAKKVGFSQAYSTAAQEMESAVKAQKDNRLVIGGPISRAFGKINMITQMVASPVAVTDHEGKIIEVPIERSFSEGMDMGSFWALIPGSRKGLMDRTLSTADTGAFGKSLIAATVDTTISMIDCGTMLGIEMGITDPDALDRVVASGSYRGKITTPQLVRNLKARGTSKIKVRSPLRCEAHRGVCAKCFGPLENGNLPNIGYHIGTLAGQTISEPATQLTMKTFHTGGAIGGASLGYSRLKQILEMPTNVKGRAILAMQPGEVNSIETSAAGGWNVTVDNMRHFVPKEVGLGVKKRQKVVAGQMLSAGGAVKPQDILAATNSIQDVQTKMIADMSKVFTDAGVRVKRKIFEIAIHPLTTRAQVDDSGDADMMFGVHQGDVMSVNSIEQMNKDLRKKNKQPIEFTPTLMSIRKAPQYANDFIGQLVAEKPHQTLKAAPGLGSVSNIGPSGHPIATYAFGKYFNTRVEDNMSKVALTEELDTIMGLMVEPGEIIASDLDEDVNQALEKLAAHLKE